MFKKDDFWNLMFLIFTVIGTWVSLKQLQTKPNGDNETHNVADVSQTALALSGLPNYLTYNVPDGFRGDNNSTNVMPVLAVANDASGNTSADAGELWPNFKQGNRL